MAETFPNRPMLPVGSIGVRSSGFAGMLLLILSEASIFVYLFFSYFYFSVHPHPSAWPTSGAPSFQYSAPQSGVMLAGCITMWWAERSAARNARSAVLIALALSFLLGLGFITLEFFDWYSQPFSLSTNAYSSLYFIITGVHLTHVVGGTMMVGVVFAWYALGYFGPLRHAPITITAVYWYFLTVAWLWLFFVIYGTPRLT